MGAFNRKSHWLTVIDDEDGHFELEFYEGRVFFHLTLRRWDTDVLRRCRNGIAIAKRHLRKDGYRRIHVIIPEGDEKLHRFESMFGFRDVRRAAGHVLMSQET